MMQIEGQLGSAGQTERAPGRFRGRVPKSEPTRSNNHGTYHLKQHCCFGCGALDAEYQSIKQEIDSIGSTTNYNGGQVFTNNTLNVFLSDGSTSGSSTIGVTTSTLSSAGLGLGGATAATGTLTQTAGAAAVAATNKMVTAAHAISAATQAHATLTTSAAIADGDTVTVGTTQYTFKSQANFLNGGTTNQIDIGGNGDTSAMANLVSAIMGSPGGAGVAYGEGTNANTFASAVVTTPGTADGTTTAGVVTVTANINGLGNGSTTGNSTVLLASAHITAAGGGTLGGAGGTAGAAGDTVTVGGQTYTYVTNLSTNPTQNEVIYGGSNTSAVANLVAAVNDATQTVTNGVGAQYSVSTAKNANVTAAVDGTATTADFVANIAGTAGNFITGSTTNGTGVAFTNLDFGGAGSTHGTDAGAAQSAAAGDTITTGGQTYTFVNALSTVPVQNQVLVGSTETASLNNLANAINGGTGSGTTYSSNTQANTNVTATTGSNATGLETLTITATTKGLTGNTIATQTTGTANTFGGSLLSGGAAGSTNDLLTQADAQAALTLINNSVSAVAALRGNIGSTVNRLQSASNVINNQTQNLTAAENDVTAADIPSTVASLSQYSILEQTGISALAQANQQQQLVLKLLQ